MKISIKHVMKRIAKAALYACFIASGVLMAVAGVLSIGSGRNTSPDRIVARLSALHESYVQKEFPKRGSSFRGMAMQFGACETTGGGTAIHNTMNYLMCFMGCPDLYKTSPDGLEYVYLCNEGDPMGSVVFVSVSKNGEVQQVGFCRQKEVNLQGYHRFLPQVGSEDRGRPGK